MITPTHKICESLRAGGLATRKNEGAPITRRWLAKRGFFDESHPLIPPKDAWRRKLKQRRPTQ